MQGDAAAAAAVFAVDPAGIGGVWLRASASDAHVWLDRLRTLLPLRTPWQRIPVHAEDAALFGGLDLGATLESGRPVRQTGLLARADGGVLVLGMAERATPALAGRLGGVLDTGELVLEREGLAARQPAHFGLVALDEGAEPDERLPTALADRLGLQLWEAELTEADPNGWTRDDVEAARVRLAGVRCDAELVRALCAAALSLGVDSLRAPTLALRVARAAAALDGAASVDESHAAFAARLVLAPRATRMPAPPPDAQAAPPAEPEAPPPHDASGTNPPPDTGDAAESDTRTAASDDPLAETVLAAARAALPPGLLASIAVRGTRGAGAGRSGALTSGANRGRPIGARRAPPRAGARLNVIETLRAAAPWQPLRAREWQRQAAPGASAPRVHVRRDDFHVTRYKISSPTTTVFVVDASGSSALHRLAEAKGAVELLLADCYVRRDRVAVLAFRGTDAQLLLPPTRSLARAKRSLAGLPGGGGTPLAAGLEAARSLADAIRRRGETPVVVVLTDGRANIARDGQPGRERAAADALAAARALQAGGFNTLLLDTSPHPQPAAQALAAAMGGRYLPLPHAGPQSLSHAVMGTAAG